MELAELLAGVAMFDAMPPERLDPIAECARDESFAEGDYLLREGDQANTFFVIRRGGSVALEMFAPPRGPMTIETLEAGEVVGWSWLFPPYRWHFDARALTPVRATVFDGACLRGKFDADPELGYQMMKRFATVLLERLQETRVQMLDVYGHSPA